MKYLPVIILSLIFSTAVAQPLPALIPYYDGEAWGYCDSNKKIKIKPQWYEAGLFYDGRAIVKAGKRNSTTLCLINTKGEYIIPPERQWNGALATPSQVLQLNAHTADDKWGLIDSANNVLIPFIYDVPKSYPYMAFFTRRPMWSKLFMVVTKNGKKGVVDSANNTLVPFEYDDIWMSGGTDAMAFRYDSTVFFKVWKDGKAGIVDTGGGVVIPCVYDAIYYNVSQRNQPGFVFATKNGRMGVMDWKQQIIVPFAYDSVWVNNDDGTHFFTMTNYKRGYIDLNKKYEIPPSYSYVYPQGEMYVVATLEQPNGKRSLNGLYKNGKLVVQPQYQGLYVQGDSIIVMRYDDPMQEGHLNPKTFKLQGGWKPYVSPFADLIPRQGFCGTAYVNRRDFPDPLYIPGRNFDEKIYSFEKDSIRYSITAYIKKNDSAYSYFVSPEYQYYAVAGQRAGQWYYAVVDRELHYFIAPQSRYRIEGGNISKGVLIVSDSNRYALANLEMNPLTAFQMLRPYAFFSWKGRYYMIAGNAGDNGKLVDDNGQQIKAFQPYRVTATLDSTGINQDRNFNFSGRFVALDSQERLGMLDVYGNVLYPEVSFKYKRLTTVPGQLFLVGDEHTYRLVDALNVDRLPGIQLEGYYTPAQLFNAVSYYKQQVFPALYSLRFYKDGLQQDIYIGSKGTVYAGSL